MAAYATFDDVIKRYNPLTTLIGSGETNVTTQDISSVYIADAEGVVNAYLGSKYILPLAMPEPLITRITCDLSIYKLLEDRVPRVPEIAQNRNDYAEKMLAMLRDGQMTLAQSQSIIAGGNEEAYSNTASYHPVFSPVLDPLDQKADQSQIDAERAERITDL